MTRLRNSTKKIKVTNHNTAYVAWENLIGNLKLHDEFECELKDGSSASFVLIDDSGDRLTFCSKNCITKHCINETSTNKGGIAASDMQKFLDTEIWNLLPDELKSMISVTTRKYMDGEQLKEFDTKLFLLSASEVFGKDKYYIKRWLYEHEQIEQIDYFKEERNHCVKYIDSEPAYWWISSPYAGNSTHFCLVSTDGEAVYSSASTTYGVVPCFCIKKS